MRHFTRNSLLALIACVIGCGPVAETKPQGQTEETPVAKPDEASKNPFDDIQKDQVNEDNFDKPLIKDAK